MLSWRRIVFVVAVAAAAKGVIALLAADDPKPAVIGEAPILNSEFSPPAADQDSESKPAEDPKSFTPSPEFQEWITSIARQQLPEDYEKRKNWGHTTKTFDGVSIKVENGKLKTNRKYKEANDGEWQLYRVKLKDPEKNFDVQVANVRKLPEGKVGLEITAVASLEVFARQSQWEHGVQIYSLSAEADARVKLWARTEVATHIDVTRFPPDISLDPEITAAKIEIPDFRMR